MDALIKKYIFLLCWILSALSYFFSISVLAATGPDFEHRDATTDKSTVSVNVPAAKKITTPHHTAKVTAPVFVFVDPKLDNYQTLVKDIEDHRANKNITIVYLDPEQDGVQQITDILADQTGVAAIHLLTHGMAGSIKLGNVVLNADTLALHRSKLILWRKSLSANADILVYGCNVASTDAGLQLIQHIGDLTHAHIAASTNVTGAASFGADWKLESHYGKVHTNVIVSAQTQQSWDAILAYTSYISIGPGGVDQTFTASSNVGTSFSYDSPGATYSVTRVAVQLKILSGADTSQNITLCLRSSWNGANLSSATLPTSVLTTSFAWYAFNVGATTLNDNQVYYIQIYTLSTDAKTVANTWNSSQWNSNTELMVGVTNYPSKELSFILSTGTNSTPAVNSAIPDQAGTENVAFSYTFSATAFTDADTGDRLTYTATLSSGAALPAWLSFNATTRTFSGTPLTANVGTISVKVTASDGTASTNDTFDIVIASNLSYYRISLSSPGVTCAGSAITISAYNASNALVAPANGTVITLSTSPATGTWVGGNTATFDGVVTSVTKYLQQTTAATLNINVTDGTHSESASYDPDITFNAGGLTFYGSSGLIAMQNEVAGTADTAPVLKATNCTSQVTGAKNVSFGYECRNPTTCIGGQTLSVNSNSIQSNSNGATIVYSAAQSLTFTSGVASIPLNYTDVGKVKIYATMTLAASGNDPAITLTGNSGDIVVKPHTLVATLIQTAGAVANPGGSSAAGAAAQFVPAGTAFTVKVEVRNSAGSRTPNFGNEAVSENNLTFVPQSLVYPTGGTLTALSSASAFSATTPAGTFINSTINWNQVGSITARPELADNDYLGAGDVVAKTTSGTIGRFYPDHFTLVSSSSTNSCSAGTFSYMDQPAITLNYIFQAQGSTNSVLTNYGGNYSTATVSYVAESNDTADGATFTSARLGTPPAWASGVVSVAGTTTTFARQSSTAPDGPFLSLRYGLLLSDSLDSRSIQSLDMNALTAGACSPCTAKQIGSTFNMYYGRLRLDNASGPETVKLPVNFATEYWVGSYFSVNTSDSCTIVPRSAITYTPGGALTTDAYRTVSLSVGTTTGTYNNIDGAGVHFNAGSAGHYFSKPTAAGMGSIVVGINLSTLAWLRYDWNRDGTYSDTTIPNATYTFGSYRGNDRVLYWHEKL